MSKEFERGGRSETIALSADAYSGWLKIPEYIEGTVFRVTITNVDSVGVIKFEGRQDDDEDAYTPLAFEETDGTVDTDGYDVASGTDVDTPFDIKRRWNQIRFFYDWTSGGSADSAVVSWAHYGHTGR